MKIIFLADSIVLQRAGIKFYNRQLLEAIRSYPNLVSLTLIVPEYSQELADYDQVVCKINGGIPFHEYVRKFTTIPKKVNALNPDIVIEPAHFGPFGLNPAIKRVTVIHDFTPIDFPEFHPRSSSLIQKLFLPKILNRANLIISNSESTSREIQEKYNIGSQPVYPVIPYTSIATQDSKKSPYILSIGTLEPRKDYITLLKAFENVASDYLDLQLVIVGGTGWKNEKFSHELAQSPVREKVRLTGYITEVEKQMLINEARLYVSCSVHEGLGMPLLEMLTSNTAILCSDIPSYQEIGGPSFQYFNAKDYKRLAELIAANLKYDKQFDYNNRINLLETKRAEQLSRLFNTFDSWK